MNRLFLFLSIILCCAGYSCGNTHRTAQTAIIPEPVSSQYGKGTFKLDRKTVIVFPADDSVLSKAAMTYSDVLSPILGGEMKFSTEDMARSIRLEPLENPEKPEQYQLEITRDQVTVRAADYSGAFYGLQTILQLLPPDVYGGKAIAKSYKLPALTIDDYPRFGWRGMHLDVVRHFFGPEFVKKYIDLIAMHKMNTFHWHLTDEQGWRIEIKKYPLLTEKSAWRVDRREDGWNSTRMPEPGEGATYGGFYTQEEVREIVAYAKDRGVRIVPEIEMPGHSGAVFASYPNLSCLKTPQYVNFGGYFPPEYATCYCAGNDSVFVFLQDVIDEVIELFPEAPYIHIGGDEVDKRFWRECPTCQARMKKEGLKDVDELQSYFIHRMEEYVNSKGKPIIGWDEILQGGLAPNATVMSWRGEVGGIAAARLGHDVVMAPDRPLYFDHYQNDPQVEPRSMTNINTLKDVYGYEPVPVELNDQEAKHILGAQATMWNEFVQTEERVFYQVLPRMTALAEVVWSPKDKRDFADFCRRLDTQLKRFDAMGVNYHPGADMIEFQSIYDSTTGEYRVTLTTQLYKGDIYYTTDGTEPTIRSTRYTEPIRITEAVTIRAAAGRDNEIKSSQPSERRVGRHKATGATVYYNTNPSGRYTGTAQTLVDGLTGAIDHTEPAFQGYHRDDFDAVIDLGERTSFSEVTASFLQSVGSWVYLPVEVTFSTSDDGLNFTDIGTVGHGRDGNENPTIRYPFTVVGEFEGRYIRVRGINGVTPSGLPNPGHKNWMFIDEIFVL